MLDFDEWLTNYTWTGFILVLVAVGFYYKASVPDRVTRLPSNVYWAGLLLGLLLLMRLPFIAYNRELDVDEGQMLAQAMSLKQLGGYWQFVDGLTQGPLTSYALIIPSWLGLPFDYTSGRLMGVLLLFLTLLAIFFTLRNLFRKTAALMVFTPVACFFLLSQGVFSTLYNEYLVMFLLALCFWQFSAVHRQTQPRSYQLLLLGFLAGMVPFAKLQGVPTALLIVIFTVILIVKRSQYKIRHLACLVGAGILFPAIVLVQIIRYDVLDYFWQFYVLGNMEYSGGGSIWDKALRYPGFLRQSGQFFYFFICNALLIVGAAAKLIWPGGRHGVSRLIFWFGLLHVIIGFFVVIKPGYLFPHYQLFLIIPLTVLAGTMVERGAEPPSWSSLQKNAMVSAWLLTCFAPHFVSKWASTTSRSSGSVTRISRTDLGKPLVMSPVGNTILRFSRPGELLTIWGWHPAYHLETRLSQATADVIPFRVLTPGPRQQSHLQRYLRDLEKNMPVVFVDQITTASFWFNDPAQFGHARIPGLSSFISKHYHQVATIHGETIYVLKERLSAR
ncbi:hypothetical protein [Dyadobacter sp. BHUBP1]|uniref:hypothetical protein n=1 Tax=Dyadobacter sp. BHUBP1 TaxID=3424178 RepID=UPI003D34A30D